MEIYSDNFDEEHSDTSNDSDNFDGKNSIKKIQRKKNKFIKLLLEKEQFLDQPTL